MRRAWLAIVVLSADGCLLFTDTAGFTSGGATGEPEPDGSQDVLLEDSASLKDAFAADAFALDAKESGCVGDSALYCEDFDRNFNLALLGCDVGSTAKLTTENTSPPYALEIRSAKGSGCLVELDLSSTTRGAVLRFNVLFVTLVDRIHLMELDVRAAAKTWFIWGNFFPNRAELGVADPDDGGSFVYRVPASRPYAVPLNRWIPVEMTLSSLDNAPKASMVFDGTIVGNDVPLPSWSAGKVTVVIGNATSNAVAEYRLDDVQVFAIP